MARKIKTSLINNSEKLFIEKFKSLCSSRSSWQVWSDFIVATACAIANAGTDRESELFKQREEEYKQCAERLGSVETIAEMLAIITMALDENPEQDFLGGLFMKLKLNSYWKAQFFTPYCVCKTMAVITSVGMDEEIKNKGWVSINDSACGAGATLIAMANTLKEQGINYHNHALFVAQDIDRIAGLMCYIQLSLLGCPGYVVIADSLANPVVGNVLRPIQKENQEFWFTPMYLTDVWRYRRLFNMMDEIIRS